jgi:hypothetical protein
MRGLTTPPVISSVLDNSKVRLELYLSLFDRVQGKHIRHSRMNIKTLEISIILYTSSNGKPQTVDRQIRRKTQVHIYLLYIFYERYF